MEPPLRGLTPEEVRATRLRGRIDLCSTATHLRAEATMAVARVGKFSNLAMQRSGIHASLFVQWIAAMKDGKSAFADFLLARFPEPLKAAAIAWQARNPQVDPQAPPTPFDMPEYVLPERAESERWEQTALSTAAAADRADEISGRFLPFTIIFACVLFFAGIGGKFRWPLMDVIVLVLGTVALIGGISLLTVAPQAP